jgi:prepilin-type N-terminal cleavage/methylation domain-containing protein/prepilin-type processing-associated H-X9-DG protein
MHKQLTDSKQNKCGFTLIELLVVIAIIAILAAILFPVFGRARENARRSNCQSNLKQIGLGLIQYAQDYDEAQPLTAFGGAGPTNWPSKYKWMDAIYPYIKSQQVFTCPSNTAANATNYVYAPSRPGATLYDNGSYVYNNAYYSYPNTSPARVNLAAIVAPTTTAWILEQFSTNNIELAWGNAAANPQITKLNGVNRILAAADVGERHLDTTTVLFCDGHVKSMKLSALTATKQVVPNGSVNPQPLMTAFTIQDD